MKLKSSRGSLTFERGCSSIRDSALGIFIPHIGEFVLNSAMIEIGLEFKFMIHASKDHAF
jgi:hypothetical protein